MAANFLGVQVSMHCTDKGYDSYNTIIKPVVPKDNSINANVLWCKLTDDADISNHFAPLMYCPDAKTGTSHAPFFNNYSLIENWRFRILVKKLMLLIVNFSEFNTSLAANKKCAACQLVCLEEVENDTEMVQCKHCLIWFHRQCTTFTVARHHGLFSCGCAQNIDRQWYASDIIKYHQQSFNIPYKGR